MDQKKILGAAAILSLIGIGSLIYSRRCPQDQSLEQVLDYIDQNPYHNETILNYVMNNSDNVFSARTYQSAAELTEAGMDKYPESLRLQAIEISRRTLDYNPDDFINQLNPGEMASILDSYVKTKVKENAVGTLYVLENVLDNLNNSDEFRSLDHSLGNALIDLRQRVRVFIRGEECID